MEVMEAMEGRKWKAMEWRGLFLFLLLLLFFCVEKEQEVSNVDPYTIDLTQERGEEEKGDAKAKERIPAKRMQ